MVRSITRRAILAATVVVAIVLGIGSLMYWGWSDEWPGIDEAMATLLAWRTESRGFERFQPVRWACPSQDKKPGDRAPHGSISAQIPDPSEPSFHSRPTRPDPRSPRLADARPLGQHPRDRGRTAQNGDSPTARAAATPTGPSPKTSDSTRSSRANRPSSRVDDRPGSACS